MSNHQEMTKVKHNHRGPRDSHGVKRTEQFSLAMSATIHCLVGCGIGEVAGIVWGRAMAWSNVRTLVVAVLLGFVFGFILGLIPLLRAGFRFGRALRQVFIAESLSIVVMETAEVLVEVYTPGVMAAGLGDLRFWLGMLLALIAGFAVAYPVNYVLIGRGVRHIH